MDVSTARLRKAEDLAEINRQQGQALGQLQLLEESSIIVLVLMTQAVKSMGQDAGNALLLKAKRRTFGQTIAEMVKADLLSEDLKNRFQRIRDERNWLVHNFVEERHQAMRDYSVLLKLINRLRAIGDESRELMKALLAESENFLLQNGLSAEEVQAEMERACNPSLDPYAP